MPSCRNDQAPSITSKLLRIEEKFCDELEELELWDSYCVYNPLIYAAAPRKKYIKSYLNSSRENLFLGMNPGPYGMAQNGIPFGDTHFVTEWLDISGEVTQPPYQHPKKPILGFDCSRRDQSGILPKAMYIAKGNVPYFPSPGPSRLQNLSKKCWVLNKNCKQKED